MRLILTRLLALFAVLPFVALNAAASELRRDVILSTTLGENLSFVTYVPDGYDASRIRYPVVYLLHGAGGDSSEWTSAVKLQQIADRMIASGEIPPALFVMPECIGCWWIDSPRANMETAFFTDLIPAIGRRFRVIEGRDGRAIAGYSAGGFGAVRMALRYPGRFAAMAAFSPAVYAGEPHANSMARTQRAFRGANGAFSPELWKSHNYPALVDGYRAQPERVPMYLVSGDHDKLGIAFQTATLFNTMFEIQGDLAELRVADGGHSTEVAARALPDALKFVFKYLQKPVTQTAGAAAFDFLPNAVH